MFQYVESVVLYIFSFSYVIKDTICCLCLCDRQFPRNLAFSFLDDVAQEFLNQNAHQIDRAVRPYHFLEFGKIRLAFYHLHF